MHTYRLEIAAAILLLSVFSSAWAVNVGEVAPPLVAQGSNGLPDLQGKVVYVDFWASWCTPCRRSMPLLDRLQSEWSADGFVVLGVNVDTRRADALGFLQRTPVSFPIVYDPEGAWAGRFNISGMPSGYLIGRNGIVRHVSTGYRADELAALEALVRKTLQERP